MKLPDYIACMASYYDTDPSVDVMRSIVITKTKDDSTVVSRYFMLNDYSDDEACDEMDAIVGDFKKQHPSTDVVFGNHSIKREMALGVVNLRAITAKDYIGLLKRKYANS